MNKRIKRYATVLMVVSIIFTTCTQFLSAKAGSKNSIDENNLITRVWDFNDKAQESDFTFLKKSADNVSGYIPDGRLTFAADRSSDGNRRALLDESMQVKRVSVDIYPQGTSWKEGGIILGDDGNNGNNNLLSIYASNCVEFKICTGSSSEWIALKAIKYKKNVSLFEKWYSGMDSTKPMRLTLEVDGTTVKATITVLDGSKSPITETIDITKNKSGNATSYTEDILVGRPGLSAGLGTGVEFNNFTVSTADSETRVWDFDSQSQEHDFVFLKKSTSNVSGYIPDGRLVFAADSSSDGNRRALLNESLEVKSVSVDIYPQGTSWKEGGIILGGDSNNGTNNLLSIYASNCVEFKICTGSSSEWIALKAIKYKENVSLFEKWYSGMDSTKPMRLTLEVDGTTVKATIAVLDGSKAPITETIDITKDKSGKATSYTEDVLTGRPGLSAGLGTGVKFNDFTVSLYDSETMIWDFDVPSQEDEFSFLKKNENNMSGCVQDGTMSFKADNSSDGNRRAILNKALEVEHISVDIYPQGANWKEGGIILGDNSKNSNSLLSIYASNSVEFKVRQGSTREWLCLEVTKYSDVDSDVTLFSKWYQGLQGRGNENPIRLTLEIDGTTVKATITMLDGSGLMIRETIDITKDKNGNATSYAGDVLIGKPGLSAGLGNGVKFDNLTMKAVEVQEPEVISIYKGKLLSEIEKVQALKQGNMTDSSWAALLETLESAIEVVNTKESTERNFLDAYCALLKAEYNLSESERPDFVTKTYNFDKVTDALDFEFYRSGTTGGFNVSDGKLLHYRAKGEAKALLNGEGRTYESVSVDIYPGEDGLIYAGLYLGASNAGNADDDIEAAALIIESRATDISQINLILGEFPWKSIKRTSISNANGNALFTEGKREPLNLQVDINGNELVIRLSLLNDPEKFVYVTYEYTGNYVLSGGNIGLRSLKSNNMFDDLTVTYYGGMEESTVYIERDNNSVLHKSPNTYDRNEISKWLLVSALSVCGIVCLTITNKKKIK